MIDYHSICLALECPSKLVKCKFFCLEYLLYLMCYVYDMTLVFHSFISYWVYDIIATVKHNESERKLFPNFSSRGLYRATKVMEIRSICSVSHIENLTLQLFMSPFFSPTPLSLLMSVLLHQIKGCLKNWSEVDTREQVNPKCTGVMCHKTDNVIISAACLTS